MVKSDGNGDKKVTILDIKENLKDNSLMRLISLVIVLIYSMCELTKDKESVKTLMNLKLKRWS